MKKLLLKLKNDEELMASMKISMLDKWISEIDTNILTRIIASEDMKRIVCVRSQIVEMKEELTKGES